MGPLLTRALERAGLTDVAMRALAGPLGDDDLARLRTADLLLVGGLADAVRAKVRGTTVRIGSLRPSAPLAKSTGAELLREIALQRLSTSQHVSVSVEELGAQIALVALAYGADELLVAPPSLSRPDPFSALTRMIEEAGRSVVREPVARQAEVTT